VEIEVDGVVGVDAADVACDPFKAPRLMENEGFVMAGVAAEGC